MANENLSRVYSALVAKGTIKVVPYEKQREVRERFITFYSRFDKRLHYINRERISVTYNDDGRIVVACTYYGTAYLEVYNN